MPRVSVVAVVAAGALLVFLQLYSNSVATAASAKSGRAVCAGSKRTYTETTITGPDGG